MPTITMSMIMTSSPKLARKCARFFVPGSRVGGSSLTILRGVTEGFDVGEIAVVFSTRLVGAAALTAAPERISAPAIAEIQIARWRKAVFTPKLLATAP
jgi:hypothetical protein